MKFLALIFCFFIVSAGYCQLRCVDVIERLEPDPYELLNDSISKLATADQIEELIKEQNLLFSYNFDLRTLKITSLQLDYFEEGLLNGEKPLNLELIKRLEDFFKRNLNVIVKPKYSNFEKDQNIECAFISPISKE